MSLKYLTKRNALNATTKLGITTNFNHLRSIPRAWLIRRSKHDPKLKSVRPSDRIKWWNIVPGDQIRLRGDPDSTLHEVLSINRLSNRVFLKNTAVCLFHPFLFRILTVVHSVHDQGFFPSEQKLPLFKMPAVHARVYAT